jgi:C-terminal processing protease CtpA/Prc
MTGPSFRPGYTARMRCLTVIVLLMCSVRAAAQAPWTLEQMQEDLDQLAAAVRAEWSYYEDRTQNAGLDLDALVGDARARLDGVESAEDFALVLQRIVAGLKDGHGGVRMSGLKHPLQRLPVWIEECDAGFVIAAVAEEGEAAGPMPRAGDVLVSVNGTPIEKLVAEAREFAIASTDEGRRVAALRWIRRSFEPAVLLEWETRADGDAAERVKAEVRTISALQGRPGAAVNWTLSWPRPKVALLRISSFGVKDWARWLQATVEERPEFLRETYQAIDDLFAQIAEGGAEALVLDIRENGGGTDSLGIHMAKHLLREPFEYFRLSSKVDGKWTAPGSLTYQTEAHMRRFEGPLYALVDGGSFSTTDNFLRCMRDLHPQFTVVGRPTGGGTGAPRPIVKLTHSGAEIVLCTMRVYGPTSDLIEGRGTAPDIAVRWSREDWLHGRDPDLNSALEAIDSEVAR